MRIGIVGAHGFIGSALREELHDHEVVEFTRERPITSEKGRTAAADLDAVVWAASSNTPATLAANPGNAEQEVREFSEGLDLLSDLNLDRLIVLSSGGTVYGHAPTPHDEETQLEPVSDYGKLKAEIERVAKEKCPNVTILRLSNVYGPGQEGAGNQGVLAHWLTAIANGDQPVIYGDPEIARDYVYVGDAVRGIRAALERDVRGTTINLGSGTPTSLNELQSIVADVTGMVGGADLKPGRPYDNRSTWLRIERARELLDWEPTVSLQDGIRLMWKWKEQA